MDCNQSQAITMSQKERSAKTTLENMQPKLHSWEQRAPARKNSWFRSDIISDQSNLSTGKRELLVTAFSLSLASTREIEMMYF